MRKVIKCQGTIFERTLRELTRKMSTLTHSSQETLGATLDKTKR